MVSEKHLLLNALLEPIQELLKRDVNSGFTAEKVPRYAGHNAGVAIQT
jgi:hypothetical protein